MQTGSYTHQVLSTLKKSVNRRKNKNFTGYELTRATGEGSYWGLKYASTMRALRTLKENGTIDYVCTDRYKSQYTLTAING